jgi:ribosomal protein S18 acetylase RimI-like enzyme
VAIDYTVIVADPARLDDVAPLWKAMVEHHRALTAGQLPVRTPDEAWLRRRREYSGWLSSGRAWLLLAVDETSPEQAPDGYAVVRLAESGATWDLGDAVGDLESLSVAEHARGRGIGTKLMDAARELLRSRGVGYWSVTVAAGNAGAIRLYEREGFRPRYQHLLARL